MGSLSNVLNLIKEDLYKDKKDSASLNFFYLSMLHYAISLEIASSAESTFEILCKQIPRKYGCRSSIKAVLDNGVVFGFFIKESKLKDRRFKSYKLSEEYSLMITQWYLSRKEKYSSY